MTETNLEQGLRQRFAEALKALHELAVYLGPEAVQLWDDAAGFANESQRKRVSTVRQARLLRATVIMGAAALEGTINFLAEKVAKDGQVAGRRLRPEEVDYLCERRWVMQNGKIIPDKLRCSSRDRFSLLFRILNGGKDSTPALSGLLSKLKDAFNTRDRLLHPKPADPLDPLQPRGFWTAHLWFLTAGISLANAWKNTKQAKPRPVLVQS